MTEKFHIHYNKVTLRELEDKDLDGVELTEKEAEALRLFREIRLKKLQKDYEKEEDFHSKYEYFRELSNFLDYQEFLSKARFSF